jgi:hypothetical protein
MNKTWCPLPWKSLNIRNNGDYRVCCNASSEHDAALIRDASGTPFNASSANIESVRNSTLLRELRQSMLRGERHSTCERCHLEEDAGLRPRRVYECEFWQDEFTPEDALKHTDSAGGINTQDLPIGYMDVRFGNLCNLKCLMCGPDNSSLWYSDHFEVLGQDFTDSNKKIRLERHGQRVQIKGENPYAWHEGDFFWREIRSNLQHIRKIYCVGGEPLLIEQHRNMLQMLLELGRPEQVILEYHTNLTVLPAAVLNLWRNFKEVRIMASLDGFGPINDYIRHPSRWATVERNLDLLDSIDLNIKLSLFTTLQIFNIFHLTDFLKWKISRNFNRVGATSTMTPFIKTQPLNTPSYLSIRALPVEAKEMVTQKFESFYHDWFLSNVEQIDARFGNKATLMVKMAELLNGYKNWMWQEDLSHELPTFVERAEKLDRLRQQNWREIIPEFVDPILGSVNGSAAAAPSRAHPSIE